MIFLIQSPHAWRGLWQRPHHLASRFAAAGHRVRYVEPRYVRWLFGERERFFRSRAERPAERIEVAPVTLINGERFPPIRARNQRALAAALNRSFNPGSPPDSLDPNEPRVLWLYNPHESALADAVPHDLLIYDIMDEYRGFPWSPPRVADEESALLARADWVFAGTHALFESKRPQAEGRIECVLSGVETERFRRPPTPAPPPADIAPLRARHKKLLGYAGMIDLRIDQPLLADSAARHPEWGFVLIGGEAADLSTLRAQSNIYLLGQKSYDDLASYYWSWDCALIPFVENDLTRHINPTKILEYAAAGLPVVSRALPDVERYYADGAFLYRTPAKFESALLAALDPARAAEKQSRANLWAAERSWDALAARMLDRVGELATRKRGG